MQRLDRWSFVVVALVATATAHPICNLLFDCGCDWLGPRRCNIHHAVGPHCPWCVGRWRFVAVAALWLVGAALGMAVARRVFGRRAPTTIAGGLVGFALAALASGWVTARLTGSPLAL